jgi:Predicted transcriptional regulators
MVMKMSVDYGKLGERVRKQRERGCMSQAKLAEAADVSIQHISNIENAKTKVSLEKLVDIANVLDCSMDELVCDSLVKAKVIYVNEAVGMFSRFSDAQVRALPEFLRSCTYFFRIMEKNMRREDV